MDEIIEVLQVIGIKYNIDDIRVKLESNTENKILKEYLAECYFWFNLDTKLLSLTDDPLYSPFIKLRSYDCYRLFGIETLRDLTEKNYTLV